MLKKDKKSTKIKNEIIKISQHLSTRTKWKYWIMAQADPTTGVIRSKIAKKAYKLMLDDGWQPNFSVESLRKESYEWESNSEYIDFHQKMWKKVSASLEWYFDKLGMRLAAKNFDYWFAMQKKFYKLGESKEVDVNLNGSLILEDEYDFDKMDDNELREFVQNIGKLRKKKQG